MDFNRPKLPGLKAGRMEGAKRRFRLTNTVLYSDLLFQWFKALKFDIKDEYEIASQIAIFPVRVDGFFLWLARHSRCR
jgi:hypothetical protein